VKWKGWTRILLILFLITDLLGNMGFYGREKVDDFFQKGNSLEIISSDKGNFRVFSTLKTISMDTTILIDDPTFLTLLKERNLPSMNLLYRLHDIWGIDVIRVKRTDDLFKAFTSTPSISTTRLIDLYGVKYITSVTPLEGNPQFELIHARLKGLQGKREDLLKENTIKIYKNRNPFPRAWLVKDFKVLDSEMILSMMTQKEFDPSQRVLLEEEPKWDNPPHSPFVEGGKGELREHLSGTKNRVEFISESNNKLHFQVRAAENVLLVLTDTYYPGWKAFVNGRETKIYRADYNFRAIPLITGTYQVEFVYDPFSFKLGALFTFLGVISCVVIALVIRRKKS